MVQLIVLCQRWYNQLYCGKTGTSSVKLATINNKNTPYLVQKKNGTVCAQYVPNYCIFGTKYKNPTEVLQVSMSSSLAS